jgi:ribulose-phosphate 3-epimerase
MTKASRVLIAPSLIAADFANLRADLARINNEADALHVDIMDGHFVPNISFGPFVVKQVRHICPLPFDVHLMISHPRQYLKEFVKAGANNITFHLEACAEPEDVEETIAEVRALSCQVGISIKPKTPFNEVIPWLGKIDRLLIMTVEPGFGGQQFMPDMLDKMRAAKAYRSEHREAKYDIEVDGGLAPETIGASVAAGAEVIVAGTAVFGKPDPSAAIRELRNLAGAALA